MPSPLRATRFGRMVVNRFRFCIARPRTAGWSLAAMKTLRIVAFSLVMACLLTLPAAAQPTDVAVSGVLHAPVVRKLEPPNWWVNYTPELTLLLTGENLSGARVESPSKGVTALGSEASANGHYLFVHLQLGSNLPSGTVPLRLITSAGATTVPLSLLARADSQGRFEGFSR